MDFTLINFSPIFYMSFGQRLVIELEFGQILELWSENGYRAVTESKFGQSLATEDRNCCLVVGWSWHLINILLVRGRLYNPLANPRPTI